MEIIIWHLSWPLYLSCLSKLIDERRPSTPIVGDEIKGYKKTLKKVKEEERTQRDYVIKLNSLSPHNKILGGNIFYILNCVDNEL